MNVLWESRFKMIDSYKNIERLRYRINKDILAIYADIKKNNEEQRIIFIEECFSAIVSSMVGLLLSKESFVPLKNILHVFFELVFSCTLPTYVSSFVALFLCILLLLLVAVGTNKILLFLKKKKRQSGMEGVDTTDYIKEFDNIACDSVFVSIEYKDRFLETKSLHEKTLYYLESVHYLETASTIITKLCADPQNIKSSKNVLGVDVYRVHNMKAVMKELCNFLEKERQILALSDVDKNEVQKHLKKINEQLDSIKR